MIDIREGATITSEFGKRDLFGQKFHYGLDVVLKNDNVPFVTGGEITSVGTSPTAGNFVTILQNDGTTATYMHLYKPATWKKGDVVNEGDIVGIQGSTGNSTGKHLHYQVKNKNGDYIDPNVYFNLYAENKPFSSYDGLEKHYITDDVGGGEYSLLGNIVRFLVIVLFAVVAVYLFFKAFEE